jgi:hypothetical protein
VHKGIEHDDRLVAVLDACAEEGLQKDGRFADIRSCAVEPRGYGPLPHRRRNCANSAA